MKAFDTDLKIKIMTRPLCFIILLGMALAVSSCATKTKDQAGDLTRLRDTWTNEVRKVVKDPARAEKMIALGIQFDEKTRQLFSGMKQFERDLQAVNCNYDSSQADYERALVRFNARRDEVLRQYLDSLFAMRQQATPEEWGALTR